MSDDTDTGTDTSTAVRNARRRANRSLVRQLRPWLLTLGVIIALGISHQGSAEAAEVVPAPPVTASESAATAPAPGYRYTVTVLLPDYTGNTTADLLTEVYAKRLIDAGFVPGRGCDCLVGDVDRAAEVRTELEVDYPGAWDRAYQAPMPTGGTGGTNV